MDAIEPSTDVGGSRGRSPLLKKRDGVPPERSESGTVRSRSAPPSRRLLLLGICARRAHRRAARSKELDRPPDPYAALRLPRRAPPPLGYFAETSHAANS